MNPLLYIRPATAPMSEERAVADADVCITDVPRSRQTQSGYGNQIPTQYLVRLNGRWRRVYVVICSNIGTAYIGRPGHWEYIINN